MRRRDFSAILLIAGAAIQPVLAEAPVKQRRIAIVAAAEKPENISEAGSGFWRTFFGELRHLGHVEGADLVVERYSAEGHPGRYGDLARDVVSLNPDIILVTGNQLARTFRPWTGATPIVATMALVDLALGSRLAATSWPTFLLRGVALALPALVVGLFCATSSDERRAIGRFLLAKPGEESGAPP